MEVHLAHPLADDTDYNLMKQKSGTVAALGGVGLWKGDYGQTSTVGGRSYD